MPGALKAGSGETLLCCHLCLDSLAMAPDFNLLRGASSSGALCQPALSFSFNMGQRKWPVFSRICME